VRIISLLFFCLLFSCARNSVQTSDTWSGARPLAILQTGEYPIWFILTEDGPVHIESIEDAVLTSALVPWPYAPYICYLQKYEETLVMAVNRFGFLKILPDTVNDEDFLLYCFSGRNMWDEYTVGGFIYFDGKPIALIYHDDRFFDSNIKLIVPQVWSFNMESDFPFPVNIPILNLFPENEKWEADTLRFGNDGLIYYRVRNKSGESPSTRMFRTDDLTQAGEEISAEVFFNSALRRADISHSSLPYLPDGFIYTGMGYIGDSIFASWEEQEDYSIGAAGFVVIKTLNIFSKFH